MQLKRGLTVADGRNAQHQRIAAAVADLQPQMVEALQHLVQIPSQTGEEGAAQQAMAALMDGAGLDVDLWEPEADALAPYASDITFGAGFAGRPNVVGSLQGTGGGRSLILNGHIDTVEVGERERWSIAPLGAEVVGDHLYGRGACDMKGGLVANLFAVVALRKAGLLPRGTIHVESTISEEDGGAGALAAVLRGYVADGALISEPTSLAIVPAQGGSLMFRLLVPGQSAHACVRDEGVSAIEKFAYLHQGILAWEARRNGQISHPLYATIKNKVPINVGSIQGGSWPSSVPELVAVEGRAGLIPGENLEEFKAEFLAEIATLAKADPWLREHSPVVEWLAGQFAPADVPVDSALVSTLAGAFEAVSGEPPTLAGVTYGADMRHFVHTGRMPCVMFGAGDVRLAHAPDESIPLADLFRATTTIAIFVAEWCGVEPAAL